MPALRYTLGLYWMTRVFSSDHLWRFMYHRPAVTKLSRMMLCGEEGGSHGR